MARLFARWATPCAASLCLLVAACASEPQPKQPGPMDEPVDAFEAVGEPQRPDASQRDRDNLSTDIERLQNAKRTYQQEQERLQAERLHHQAQCRSNPDSKKVAIEDGSGSTYCQSPKDAQ